MSHADKARNKTQQLKGQAKEQAGVATGSDRLRAEGQADQAKGSLKNAGEKVKDAIRALLGPRPASRAGGAPGPRGRRYRRQP